MALMSIVFTKTETGTQMSGKKAAGGGSTFLLCRTKENSGTEISRAEIVDLLFNNQHRKIALVGRQLLF